MGRESENNLQELENKAVMQDDGKVFDPQGSPPISPYTEGLRNPEGNSVRYERNPFKSPKKVVEKISWAGVFRHWDGYGCANEYMVLAVSREIDVEVYLNNYRLVTRSSFKHFDPRTVEILQSGALTAAEAYDDRRFMFLPPMEYYRWYGKSNIAYTMFETTKPPPPWPGLIDKYADCLVVPSPFCAEVFEPLVNVPVKMVPIGIDFSRWPYTKRWDSDLFVFLTYGNLSIRKGVDIAVDAFRKAFPRKKDVRLVLKTWGGNKFYDMSIEDDPRVYVINEDYSQEQMYELITQADVCLFPSRGEGFGMCPVEAMATGACVMLSDGTALRDLCDDRYNIPLPISHWEKAIHPHVPEQDIGEWVVPAVDELADRMRWAYNNRRKVMEMGQRSSEWVRRKYGMGRSARKLVKVFEEVWG